MPEQLHLSGIPTKEKKCIIYKQCLTQIWQAAVYTANKAALLAHQ